MHMRDRSRHGLSSFNEKPHFVQANAKYGWILRDVLGAILTLLLLWHLFAGGVVVDWRIRQVVVLVNDHRGVITKVHPDGKCDVKVLPTPSARACERAHRTQHFGAVFITMTKTPIFSNIHRTLGRRGHDCTLRTLACDERKLWSC